MNLEVIEKNRKGESQEYENKMMLRNMYSREPEGLVFHDDEESIEKHSNRTYFSPMEQERQRFLCKYCSLYWRGGDSCKCGRSGHHGFGYKYETRLNQQKK